MGERPPRPKYPERPELAEMPAYPDHYIGTDLTISCDPTTDLDFGCTDCRGLWSISTGGSGFGWGLCECECHGPLADRTPDREASNE